MGNGMLYAQKYAVTDKISIVIPTVRDVLKNESTYYNLVSSIISIPYDFMVLLDDVGIDFSSISSYEFFLLLFGSIRESDTSLIFGDLNLMKFSPEVNENTKSIYLLDKENGIIIDKAIHAMIGSTLRKINHIKQHNKKPANEEARKYMIERARKKQMRAARKASQSQLEDSIIAMVNDKNFKYNYETVLDLTIYQFYESFYQIIQKTDYDNTMIGCYAGTVDGKSLTQKDLSWWIPNRM